MINPFDRIEELETALRTLRETEMPHMDQIEFIAKVLGDRAPPVYLEQVLERAKEAGFGFRVYGDDIGDPDYDGDDDEDALEAIRACDEMQVMILDENLQVKAWLLCVQQGPGSDPEEEVADCSGAWLEEIGYVTV